MSSLTTDTKTAAGAALDPSAAPRRRQGRDSRLKGRRETSALLFVVPLLFLLITLVVIPLGRMFWYSLTSYDGLLDPRYIGLDNFRFLLEDPDFKRIVTNTLLLFAGIVVWVAIPFTVAIVLHGLKRAHLVRTGLFIPVLLPPVVVGSAFRLVLAEGGPLNSALRTLHLDALALPWVTSENLVLVSAVFMIAWAVLGTGVLLYSAGLSAIPKEQTEAAVVDGAGWWHLTWFIYRPALRPVTRFYVLLLTVTTVTGFFPWIFGLSQGGPGIASTTLDYQIYQAGIVGGVWGRASAVAVFSVLLLAVILLAQVGGSRLAAAWRERAARRPARGGGLATLLGARPRGARAARRARLGPRGVLNMRRAVACLALLAVAFPILWVTRLAFKPPEDYIGAPGSLAGGWTLSNFSDAWTIGHLGDGLLNSLLIVPLGAFIATAVGALAAFALAKLRMPGRRLVLPLIVALVAIPLTAIAIPLFDQGLQVGYTDSRLGLSLVYGALFASWGTLFMYSYFQSLPDELIDSARVDGANLLQMFLRIGLPLGAPAIATVFVMDVLVQWNELIIALVSLPDESKQTVTVAVATFSTQFRSGGPLTAAGVLIAALPVILVYFVGQRFIRAETLGGAIKG